MSRLIATAACLLLLAGGSAQAACEPGRDLRPELAAEAAGIGAEAAAEPNGSGRLFRISRDGLGTSHLFGTMHLSDPRVLELPEAAVVAFDEAATLVIESTEILDPAALSGQLFARPDLSLMPSGTRLSDLVPEERLAEFTEALAGKGTPIGSVETLQPWLLATSLSIPPCEATRQAEGDEVLDIALVRRAEAEGMAVRGLETGLEQLEALASLPLAEQAENLLAAIDLADRMPDIFETMTLLYLEGSIAAINPTIERIAPTPGEEEAAAVYAEYEARLVDRRNAVMAERLAPILAEGDIFVAVGALHLPGTDGLVERLRRDGWTVERAD